MLCQVVNLVMVNKQLQYIQHSEGHLSGQVCLNICRTQGVPILNISVWKQNQDQNWMTQLHVSNYIFTSVKMCAYMCYLSPSSAEALGWWEHSCSWWWAWFGSEHVCDHPLQMMPSWRKQEGSAASVSHSTCTHLIPVKIALLNLVPGLGQASSRQVWHPCPKDTILSGVY